MERIELSENSHLLPTAKDENSGVNSNHSWRIPRVIGALKSVVDTKLVNAGGSSNTRKPSKLDGPFDLLVSLSKNDSKLLKVIPSDVIKKRRYGSERVTPLIFASFACSVEVVEALLESGVDVNDCDAAGRLPLLLAAAGGRNDIVSVLLTYGADPNKNDCVRYRESSAAEDLAWYKTEDEYIKKYGLELPKWECNGRTSLHFAVESNSLECVECLLEKNAVPDARDVSGITPLLLAGEKVDPEDSVAVDVYEKIVKSLIERGVNVKATHEPSGISPVIRAAQLGSDECLQELLYRGADPNWTNDGKTALHHVVERATMAVDADSSCVSTLLRYGADLCLVDNEDVSPLSAIFVGVAKPVFFFNRVLDDQVTLVDEGDGNKAKVKVNFRAMIPSGRSGQEGILHALLEDQFISKWMRHKIFRHAYLRSFIHAKWKSLRYFFFLYIGVYIIHVLSLSVFATLAHSDLFQVVDKKTKDNVMKNILPWSKNMVIFTAILVLINVCVMCYVFRRRFLFSWEMIRTGIESLASIFACIMTLFDGDLFNRFFGTNNSSLSTFQEESSTTIGLNSESLDPEGHTAITNPYLLHVTSIAIFLTWLELMLQVGRLPWASDALLFTAVLKNVLRALFTYGFMIVGFAFVFFLEFRFMEHESFGDPLRSLVKTVVMMMGEFDYNGLFSADKGSIVGNDSYVIGRIVFLCFVVLIPIALMNLMLALAVSDTRDLDAESSERQLMKLAECVVHWEFVVGALERIGCAFSYLKKFRTIELECSFLTSLNKPIFPVDVMKCLFSIANNNQKESRYHESKVTERVLQYPTQPSQDLSGIDHLNDLKDIIRMIYNDVQRIKKDIAAIKEIVEEQFCSERTQHFQPHLPMKRARFIPQKNSMHASRVTVCDI